MLVNAGRVLRHADSCQKWHDERNCDDMFHSVSPSDRNFYENWITEFVERHDADQWSTMLIQPAPRPRGRAQLVQACLPARFTAESWCYAFAVPAVPGGDSN
jgi:hypothetical protein